MNHPEELTVDGVDWNLPLEDQMLQCGCWMGGAARDKTKPQCRVRGIANNFEHCYTTSVALLLTYELLTNNA